MSRVKTPSPYAAIRFTLGRASSCKILLHLNTMKVLNKFLKNGTGNYVEGVVNGRTGSGPVRSTSCETPHDTFKIASWNIGTMRGRSSEIVETITRRDVNLCCVQEVRWRGASARHITPDTSFSGLATTKAQVALVCYWLRNGSTKCMASN